MAQVSNNHYHFKRYANVGRFASYYYQLREIFATNPTSLLEIGAGDGVVGDYLRRQRGITYTSVDYAPDTKPDVVADVRALPFAAASFDVTCAFEVLEHLPFDDFEKSLSELARVARTHVLISVPHFGPPVKFCLKMPFIPEITFAFKIPFPRTHVFNGQHYWEIGKKGYPLSRVLTVMRKYGTVTKHFVPLENQYHHFFVIEKKTI
ncbi:MAG TPA: class I SAM-dependent methyltransferase [Candidatus Paceibacterota bacterium]|nr:class I SAM-dependent methyltransferase [Candidatus Paceibacterota bacterium]